MFRPEKKRKYLILRPMAGGHKAEPRKRKKGIGGDDALGKRGRKTNPGHLRRGGRKWLHLGRKEEKRRMLSSASESVDPAQKRKKKRESPTKFILSPSKS